MRAEKSKKLITVNRITLPNQRAYEELCSQFDISMTTLKNYLNVSNNRSAEKALEVQKTAINDFRGQLVANTSYEWTLTVYNDDETIVYEVK